MRLTLAVVVLLGIAGWSLSASSAATGSGLLAYSAGATGAGGGGKVFIARRDGDSPRRVGTGGIPVLSADGKRIAFVQGPWGDAAKTLVVESISGTLIRRMSLPPSSQPIGWAGDEIIAEGFDGAIHLRSVDEPNWRTLIPATSHLWFAATSPDGSQIALTDGNLWVIPTAGGTPAQLTTDGQATAAAWGPAGIAYGTTAAHTDIWLIQPDGSGARQITSAGAGIVPVAFDTDGNHLLAANPPLNNGRIWAVDLTTGAARPLTPLEGDLFPQAISPDGRTVYAAIGCGAAAGQRGIPMGILESIPFAGGKPHVLVQGACRGSWIG
jgi:hypothetical protein